MTTIRLNDETANKLKSIDGKTNEERINNLLNGCIQNVYNGSDSEKEILTNLNLLLKAFNGIQDWQYKIEEALRAHVFELNQIRAELTNRC